MEKECDKGSELFEERVGDCLTERREIAGQREAGRENETGK